MTFFYLWWLLLGWLSLKWMLLRWLFLRWLLLTFNLNKTPLGETRYLGNLYFLLTGGLGIQLFDSPFPNTVSQAMFCYLPLTVQHLCELQDTMPFHWSPSACFAYMTYFLPTMCFFSSFVNDIISFFFNFAACSLE